MVRNDHCTPFTYIHPFKRVSMYRIQVCANASLCVLNTRLRFNVFCIKFHLSSFQEQVLLTNIVHKLCLLPFRLQ